MHVAFEDAEAYCRWAGKALPTEAEWERAARGGLEGAEYAWGAELAPGGTHLANTWQGDFPHRNSLEDGYEWTAPVRAFPANGFGLYDTSGNVYEWVEDCWNDNYKNAPKDGSAWTQGQCRQRVMRGGSFANKSNTITSAASRAT